MRGIRRTAWVTVLVVVVVSGAVLVAWTRPVTGPVRRAPLVMADPGQVAAGVAPAVMQVRSRPCFGLGTGSGFVISGGRFVTNHHVIAGSPVLFAERAGVLVPLMPVTASAFADVAVLDVDAGDRQLVLGEDPVPGDQVLAVGVPAGELVSRQATVELVQSGGFYDRPGTVLRLSVPFEQGWSGSPLVGPDGQVVGVVFGTDLATGQGLAMPVSVLAAVLDAPPEPVGLVTC